MTVMHNLRHPQTHPFTAVVRACRAARPTGAARPAGSA